jgi:probable HAF family extracellular repeat protein
VVTGIADTYIPDPFNPNCFLPECLVARTFQWKNGVLTDLGALVDGVSSGPNWINSQGWIAGISENGMTDNHAVFPPEYDAVVWKNGQIINLGTFGGNWSYANAINDAGQVVGFALNTTPDSFDLGDLCENFPEPTQMHAFLWQGEALQDLGTLGTGTDSCALFVNQRGQVAGHSFTNTVVNPVTGLPTVDPFLWNGKKLVDLGTLGGTLALASSINNRGEVVGPSNLAGDIYFHPFLWSKGLLKDLGTFGGNFGSAAFINDAGQAVGFATNTGDQAQFAFLWEKGALTNLGTVDGDPCSFASGINSRSQIIGTSGSCDFSVARGFVRQNGRMADLNTLILPGSDLVLSFPAYIDDRGEITGTGVLPNGDVHAFLVIPCGEGDDDCEGGSVSGATQSGSSAVSQGRAIPDWFRARVARKYHLPKPAFGPKN